MVSTRSAASSDSNPKHEEGAGTKRKEHATSPQPEHQPKAAKKQTTIEDTMGGGKDDQAQDDSEMKDAPVEENAASKAKGEATEEAKEESKEEKTEESESKSKPEETDNGAMQDDPSREKNLPSNILERGIIYFFTRNRVGIEDSDSVGDLQRTYFVLRPLTGAKLGDGAIPDEKNNRLFALPKKTFPQSHRDRFMTFVEKSNASVKDLKENFFKGAEYETKTQGTRHQEPVVPIGEGVYAITRTEDRSTHLVYAITIPDKIGEIQKDLGLKSQGSFQISVKNPERGGPANARLPQGPKFPKK
jgi:uroporphyrinogen-III synthase